MATFFVEQSSDDIRMKLQTLRGAEARDVREMLDIAWIVYRNRDHQKERRNARLMAALESMQVSRRGVRGDQEVVLEEEAEAKECQTRLWDRISVHIVRRRVIGKRNALPCWN